VKNVSIERINVESKQEFEQMITREMSQIEKDLTVICNNVPVNGKTTLDILCHDSNGQLVIMQLNVDEDDNVLMQGMQSLDYVDRFKSFLKATYNKHKIDDKAEPRLILIAPRFSEPLQHAVKHMHGIHIDMYEWEYLKLGDHKGLRLQPIFASKPLEMPKEEKAVEKKHEPKPSKKKESKPESVNKEESQPEPPKPAEEPQETPQWPMEKTEEEKPAPKLDKEEPQKRKLKLF